MVFLYIKPKQMGSIFFLKKKLPKMFLILNVYLIYKVLVIAHGMSEETKTELQSIKSLFPVLA